MLPPARPLLLLLDGHSSHYQSELLRIAAAERVVLFCLPPHTTHLLQPLDNGVFGSVKRNWDEACHLFCSKNPGKVVNRYNVSQVFHTAWMRSMSMGNVVSSFRATGVFPPNRSVVLSQLHAQSHVMKGPHHLHHCSSHLLHLPQHLYSSFIHSTVGAVPKHQDDSPLPLVMLNIQLPKPPDSSAWTTSLNVIQMLQYQHQSQAHQRLNVAVPYKVGGGIRSA